MQTNKKNTYLARNVRVSSTKMNSYNISLPEDVTTLYNLSTIFPVDRLTTTRRRTVRRLRIAAIATAHVLKISQLIVAPLSLVTNLLSIAIFYRMRHTMQKEAVIVFVAISVVDTFALTDQFKYVIHINNLRSSIIQRFPAACKLFMWIKGISQTCSAYLVCLYTFERFISVRFPLKRAIICSGRRIRMAVAVIFVFCPAMETYRLVTYWSNGYVCGVWPGYWKFTNNLLQIIIHFCVGIILPYTCVGCLNIMIVYHMIKYRKKRAALQANSASSEDRAQKSITIMLFLASTYSIIMMTPWIVDLAIDPFQNTRSNHVYLFGKWAREIIGPWNYCGNFFFYVIGGKAFRKELVRMLSCQQLTGEYK